MLTPLPTGAARHIGPYRLLARIGAGGMGEVFLARRGQGRLVAVKAVRQGLDLDLDDAFRVRFRREMAAARAVTGPFTAALLDGDANAPLPWLATEYVPGPSLADTVARCGPLPVAAVRALGAGLARALTAVHAARVLHRDLKPGNVLLTPDGPRLIDFGIAQAFEATALTMTGVLVGTPGFMAPEQIEGSHAVVPASDVFSLGAVLCHAATGRGPFDDPELASVVFRIAQGDADLSRVPDELRGLITECLAADPARRPAPAALAERLETPGTARFPWPSEVLSLFAEYRSAAAEFEPGAPYVPTMPGEPPTAPAAPAAPGPAPAPRRRPWQWIVAAGLATAAVTAAALVLPDAPADPADPAENSPAAASAEPPATMSPAGGSAASSLVRTYGRGHSGELDASAVTPSALPGGWQPWSRKKPEGADDRGTGCVLARSTLVCRDGRGAATALSAATGEDRWTAPGFQGKPSGIQESPPETDGERVFVPSELGVTGLDLEHGDELWRRAAPRHTRLISMAYARGVLFTAEVKSAGPSGPRTTTLRARRAKTGGQLWETAVDAKAVGRLLVQGGTVYTALESGGALALSAGNGDEKAKVSGPRCGDLMGHDGAVLCWSARRGGVSDLDPETLAVRRVVGASKKPDVAPAIGAAGVLVVANSSHTDITTPRFTAYAWKSGRKLWDLPARGVPTALALADDRLLAAGTYEIYTVPLDGDAGDVTQRTVPLTDTTRLDGVELSTPLYLGGAVFAESSEGRLVSGRAL
ncbi:protein kinase [Streptomyces sp. NPDC058471]|uniref:protein kinase domain-containing protein n=1 Tax=Streptomyces sp. NPDC058471 TaxID=3346516 RepID=UPI00364F537F